jgi:small subunit ribosomal protein S16
MLAISLMRMGAKKRPFYRIVVKEKRSKRDGKYLENVGTYNPMDDVNRVNLKHERIQYWISVGAQPTETVASLIKHNPFQTEEEKAVALQSRIEKAEADKKAKLEAKKAEAEAKAKAEQEKLAAEKAEAERLEAEAKAKEEAEAKAAAEAAEAEAATTETVEAPAEEATEAPAEEAKTEEAN